MHARAGVVGPAAGGHSLHTLNPSTTCGPAQVWTGLLLVDTAPLKASLASKAEAAVEALLSQLLQKSIKQYEHVCKRCEALTEEVLEPASDTRAVLELKVGGAQGPGGYAARLFCCGVNHDAALVRVDAWRWRCVINHVAAHHGV